jgi:hypothetical protein
MNITSYILLFFCYNIYIISGLTDSRFRFTRVSKKDANLQVNKWMANIAESNYLIEYEINPNENKLSQIIRGLIVTSDTSVDYIIPEEFFCYNIEKSNQQIALLICILSEKNLYLDTICLNPSIDRIKKEDYRFIVDYCDIVAKGKKYSLNLSQITDKLYLEYIFDM